MKIRHRKTFFVVSLLVNDIFIILAGLEFAFWAKFSSGFFSTPHGTPDTTIYTQTFALVILLILPIFRAFDLYNEESVAVFTDELGNICKATTTAFILLLAATFFYRDVSYSREYLGLAWLSVIIWVAISRAILGYAYMYIRQKKNKFKEVLMIGANHKTAHYALRTSREPRFCTKIIGLLDDRIPKGGAYKKLNCFGMVQDLEKILAQNENINEVVITQSDMPNKDLMQIMLICEKHLVTYKWLPDILGILAARMRIKNERGMTLLSPREPKLLEPENLLLKRSVDMLVSFMGLATLMPLLALLACVVKINSKGGIFYSQERVGEDGKTFMLYKFRTMQADAEAKTGPVWTSQDDSRRTSVGEFLRKFNLDELPQLWNVLKGDMSLVGPRPERPFFVGQFREDIPSYMGRHKVKSGITGWAQVHGLRGDTSIEERTKFDLFYLENWSVLLDLKILFMTLFAFKNAY